MIDTDAILSGLNEEQRAAVATTEGPLLILAGAGSGKTRVITHRVAYLIGTGSALPHQIVAVTFTNKAAGEMKERIVRLAGSDATGARIGTFHALCLRILRRDGPRVGIPSSFQIYDTADQMALLKTVMKDQNLDEEALTPRAVLSRISHAKNRLVTSEEFAQKAVFPEAKTVALCYEEYERRLRRLGAVDFDDLIVVTLRLLETQIDVAERYARGCRYLLVDEYQDTNHGQYRLIRALAAAYGNLCCVGDSDQSIYRFRGADINNILEFENDYPRAAIVRLERNYRSTKTILRAASMLIGKNDRRHTKKLWTENEEGLPVHYHRARDDRDEAEAVVRIIASLSETFASGEIAVLYRTNNQSRLIEEALVRSGIRYRIVGSLRFYERKEIKDLLAYLRLLLAPGDDPSFLRAVNTPARGIGRTTIDQIASLAARDGLSLFDAARAAVRDSAVPGRASAPLRSFLDTIDALRSRIGLPDEKVRTEPRVQEGSSDRSLEDTPAAGPPIVPLITGLINATGFREHLAKAHPGDFEEREQNVEALVSAAAEFDEQEPGGGLQAFLDRSALRSDTDDVQGDSGVTLLTIHSAKGLEFSVVVLTGLEENLFPHIRSSDSAEDLEEERRLCYVAITRAKKRLVLTNAVLRRSFGDFVENPPSRFLDELPADLLVYSESSPWGGVGEDPLGSGARGGVLSPSRFDALQPSGKGGFTPRSASGAAPFAAAGRRAGFNPVSIRGSRRRDLDEALHGGSDDFAVGRIVTHPMFGRGTILHKEGAGESLRLTIRFQDAGTKKILPRHTTLVVHD